MQQKTYADGSLKFIFGSAFWDKSVDQDKLAGPDSSVTSAVSLCSVGWVIWFL